MASVPAEPGVTATGQPVAPLKNSLTGFEKIPMWRQLLFMVGLAASIAFGFALVLWTQEPDYQPLLGAQSGYDSGQVLEVLQTRGIAYRVEPSNGSILVPKEEIAKARMELAAAGVTGDQGIGLEILNQDQGLGTSQFIETARYRRGLEGELGRTVMALQAVRRARVHLAIPKQAVFIRDPRRPSASVLVELYPGRHLSPNQVKAIVNLVASSVPELKREDVTVVDQQGELLSEKPSAQDREMQMAQQQYDYTRQLEELLIQRVHNILEPIVGPENYKAEVSADVDFTTQEQTAEQYNPDAPALRSEQTLNQLRGSDQLKGGVPGALSNQPPGQVQVPEQAIGNNGKPNDSISDSRAEATRNYELDKMISYTRQQQGKLSRLSVAVVINDKVEVNSETGKTTVTPWQSAELARFTQLVEDAVGFDPARGDSVNVISAPFIDYTHSEATQAGFWEQPWFWNMVKQILTGLFLLILLFGFIRPMLRSLLGKDRQVDEDELNDISLDVLGDRQTDAALAGFNASAAAGSVILPAPHEGYEEQLNAVKGLIAEDSVRVAEVIKQWIAEDE